MPRRPLREASVGWLLVALATRPVLADPGEAPGTPASAPIRVWYRSSEGCPDGSRFVGRLGELGRHATLARVGDRVDFVVTLAAEPGQSTGRLERQTERGTVAIRQLDASACGEVAEALALSLELALAPDLPAPSAAGREVSTSAGLDVTSNEPPLEGEDGRRRWGIGAAAALITGVAPSAMPAGALFAELGEPMAGFTVRLSLGAGKRESRAGGAELDVALATARLDGCAPGWGGSTGVLQPCVALDAGVLSGDSDAPTSRPDRGPWVAGRLSLRARLGSLGAIAPEAEAGVSLPFVRYTFGAREAGDLYRSDALGLALSLGARWSP
jgi:hypothetical protein